MEPWELREWFEDYLAACNRHDLGAVRGFLAPGVRRSHLPGGADAWVSGLEELFHAFPDWQWKRIRLIVEDDRIAAHLRAGGTHTGAYLGVAATRRRVNIAEFAFYRVEAGLITEYAGTGDDMALLSQLGG